MLKVLSVCFSMARSSLLFETGKFQSQECICTASNLVKILFDIHQKSLSFPYCSATSFYVLNGISAPDNFGADCIGQAIILKQKLHDASIEAKYLDDKIVGRHRSLICEIAGHSYYLTTYLMHQLPVLLDSASLIVPSFPIAQGCFSGINFTKKNSILEVKKTWVNSCRIDKFVFDIESASNEELSREEWMRRLIHPEQKTISIRVIDFSNDDVLHYVMHATKADKTYVISSQGVSPKGTGKYDSTLRRIAELICSSPKEIQEYIYGAYLIRETLIKSEKTIETIGGRPLFSARLSR